MAVEPLRTSDVSRLEKAMQAHELQDQVRFTAIEHKADHMAGQLDVLVDNQSSLMAAFGVRSDLPNSNPPAAHRPVAIMGQSELIWKIGGAVGGLLVLEKIAVAIWPFLIGMLRAIAHIQ